MSKSRESSSPKLRQPRARKTPRNGHPTQQQIALRAYHIYLSREGTPGNAFEDWTRAERELLQEFKSPQPRKTRKAQTSTTAA